MSFIEALFVGMGYAIMDHLLSILFFIGTVTIAIWGVIVTRRGVKDNRLERRNKLIAKISTSHEEIEALRVQAVEDHINPTNGSVFRKMERIVKQFINELINSGLFDDEEITYHQSKFKERSDLIRIGSGDLA